MQTADQYFQSTQSAVEALFTGIGTYIALIKNAPVYVGSDPSPDSEAFRRWQAEHAAEIAAHLANARQFSASKFALATLCGSVLQVAAKAIEIYSDNTEMPASVADFISPGSQLVRFCVGREVHGLPVGLIVYAGRNQHTHYNETSLRAASAEVFNRLANRDARFKDPAFSLDNEKIDSFAHNITALLGWRTSEAYEKDMLGLRLAGQLPD